MCSVYFTWCQSQFSFVSNRFLCSFRERSTAPFSACPAPWARSPLSWRMLHWWRVNGSAARGAFLFTDPLKSSTGLLRQNQHVWKTLTESDQMAEFRKSHIHTKRNVVALWSRARNNNIPTNRLNETISWCVIFSTITKLSHGKKTPQKTFDSSWVGIVLTNFMKFTTKIYSKTLFLGKRVW